MLPDDSLLEIFGFYMEDDRAIYVRSKMDAWQTLVHVCRRWRSIVFGSPRRLNLQLYCTARTLVRDTLGVWPALPLAIEDSDCQTKGVDNIIALLKRSDLVCRITEIRLSEVHLEDISEAMEVPFPELTDLMLRHSVDETKPVSDSFLGGSAPRLQFLNLDRIPFPGLPKLLSSATNLTDFYLSSIPHSGYISPEAMVACLSLLTSLDRLSLGFQSPQSRPDRESRRPPPSTRTLLPVLTHFWFRGISEYLEDLVSRVDAPRLNFLDITFFNDIVFDTPQFAQFISRTPTLEAFDNAGVALWDYHATVELSSKTSGDRKIIVGISCGELDWQFSFLEQVCTSSLPPLSALEGLYITNHRSLRYWGGDIDNSSWLELLHPFSTVKNLYLSEAIAPRTVRALQELVVGRVTEVLPTLQNVFIEELQPLGPVQEAVEKFVAARQATSHSIAVSLWDRGSSQSQVPRILDLSSDSRRINPEESAHLGLP